MDSRYYPEIEADVFKLVAELRSIFDQDYEVQTMHVASTTVVQARKSSTLRDLTGLSAALTIKITPEAGGTRVEIGMQKWLDKAAIAAVAVLLSAGLLAALPALGAYWQYKLTEDAWKIVEGHISRKAGGYVPPLPGRCRSCGAANIADAEFCSACGANFKLVTCPSCGAIPKDHSARFCNQCGKPLFA
ncbi:MAG TPA: zinc ribbon domain-containing protein [Pyrinomonadaceae bacterium]|nr:zinc ribbon domain-containing protein [Pyrinomonadaceae bacterium]